MVIYPIKKFNYQTSRPILSDFKINHIKNIPVTLSKQQIMVRLGHKDGQTVLDDKHKKIIEKNISIGFSLCSPQGAWAIIAITKHDPKFIELATGNRFESIALSKMLSKSHAIVLMAATVGPEIVEAANIEITNGDSAKGVVFDATGSIIADASLNWIHKSLDKTLGATGEMITKARFSPGYSDLDLTNQVTIFNLLNLTQIGLSITPKLMLIPEKSVIGIAGIEMKTN